MLSSVLNSDRAIDVNIRIIRIFIKLREMLLTHQDTLLKMEKLEQEIRQQSGNQKKVEDDIQIIFTALKQLLSPLQPPRRQIGFKIEKETTD